MDFLPRMNANERQCSKIGFLKMIFTAILTQHQLNLVDVFPKIRVHWRSFDSTLFRPNGLATLTYPTRDRS